MFQTAIASNIQKPRQEITSQEVKKNKDTENTESSDGFIFSEEDIIKPHWYNRPFIGPDGKTFRTEFEMDTYYGNIKDTTEEFVEQIGKENFLKLLDKLSKESMLHGPNKENSLKK